MSGFRKCSNPWQWTKYDRKAPKQLMVVGQSGPGGHPWNFDIDEHLAKYPRVESPAVEPSAEAINPYPDAIPVDSIDFDGAFGPLEGNNYAELRRMFHMSTDTLVSVRLTSTMIIIRPNCEYWEKVKDDPWRQGKWKDPDRARVSNESLTDLTKGPYGKVTTLDLSWIFMFRSPWLTRKKEDTFSHFFRKFPNVTRLSLNHCDHLCDADIETVTLRWGPRLVSISLNNCFCVKERKLAALIKSAPRNSLELFNCNRVRGGRPVGDPVLNALLSQVGSALTTLRIDGWSLNEKKTRALVKAAHQLSTLSLSGIDQLTDKALEYIGQMPLLAYLHILVAKGNVQLTTEGFVAFLTSPQMAHKLSHLSVRRAPSVITDECAIAITEAQPQLLFLNVEGSSITAEGFQSLCGVLTELQGLGVAGTACSRTALLGIDKKATPLHSLRFIHATVETGLAETDVDPLDKRRLPEDKIDHPVDSEASENVPPLENAPSSGAATPSPTARDEIMCTGLTEEDVDRFHERRRLDDNACDNDNKRHRLDTGISATVPPPPDHSCATASSTTATDKTSARGSHDLFAMLARGDHRVLKTYRHERHSSGCQTRSNEASAVAVSCDDGCVMGAKRIVHKYDTVMMACVRNALLPLGVHVNDFMEEY